MKGDFSRIRFDATKRYSRVLQQQGRVTLDADGNEQTDILLHYLRTLARDLMGDYGGPLEHGGFTLVVDKGKLKIGAGRYYVHGILCESDGCHYDDQPDYKPVAVGTNSGGDALLEFLQSTVPNDDHFWVYLDVWERHLTAVEVPELREVALGGPDTCTRSKVIWQVKARKLSADEVAQIQTAASAAVADPPAVAAGAAKDPVIAPQVALRRGCAIPLAALDSVAGGLSARLERSAQPKTPCIVAPDARYRGAENQLYRVEIHRGGNAASATFKWSRDNGSIVTSWLGMDGDKLLIANARGFCAGMWVELTDDARDLAGQPGVLARIGRVEDDTLTLDAASAIACNTALHSKLRAWDQTGAELADGVPLLVGGASAWLDLEDGIQVRFAADGDYRSGDYWLIPARVAAGVDGGIDWPNGAELPPRGVEHHYAPLGLLAWAAQAGAAAQLEVTSCLCTLRPLTPCQAAAARLKPATSVAGGTGAATGKKPTTPVAKPDPKPKPKPTPKPKPKPKHG
jgi:hypothetical protein